MEDSPEGGEVVTSRVVGMITDKEAKILVMIHDEPHHHFFVMPLIDNDINKRAYSLWTYTLYNEYKISPFVIKQTTERMLDVLDAGIPPELEDNYE